MERPISVKHPTFVRPLPIQLNKKLCSHLNLSPNRTCARVPRNPSRSHHAISTVMEWKPAGLLREAVELKEIEMKLIESTLSERPDHPINLRRSFFAQKPVHRFSKALRRRDGTLSVVLAMKRFQPVQGGKPTVVAPLEDISLEARRYEACGADAALVYTDAMQYGIETTELGKITRGLKISSQDYGMPIARQDIVIDPIQIAEAAELGACAVNIVAAAALDVLEELMNAATAMSVETIVECHTELEVEYAMECGATILFLTNFDRSRNVMVEGVAQKLVDGLPPWVMKLGGGGLTSARECWDLMDSGFHGVVLGRSLLQTRRLEGFIKEIRSQKRITGDIFAGDYGVPFGEQANGE